MAQKFICVQEKKGKVATSQNFFHFYPNHSFTHITLRHKRILSHILKKLMMIPDSHKDVSMLLMFLLEIYDHSNDKSEDEILDV